MKFEAVKESKIKNAFELALFAAKEQIQTDCNFYVRVDQGTLRDSAQSSVSDDTLTITWSTPYAKRVYYTGTPSKVPNPNASLMWAAVAERKHGKEWRKILEKGMGENL